MKNALKEILNPQPAEPLPKPQPLVEPGAYVQPRPALLKQVLVFAGLPDKATLAKLEKLADAWEAELGKMKGFGHDDGRAEFKRLMRDALDGKTAADKVPRWEDVKRRNQIVRAQCRAKASKISREAALIVADVYEKALEAVPAYVAHLLSNEAALFAGASGLPDSPLKKLCDKLPEFIKFHISKLHDRDYCLCNPRAILL